MTIGAGARIGANSVVIEDVPEDATAVGIPGRIVREESKRWKLAGGRINLEHHLMPDPVGGALEMLLDRIEFLEARLSHAQDCLRQLRHTEDESERSAQ